MLVLVTGASGFIGSRLCLALLQDGHQVRAFHHSQGTPLTLAGLEVEHCRGDVTQIETLLPAMHGVEAVFHAAARVGRWVVGRHEQVTVGGTRNVLHAAQQAGVRRVVHTSSVAALGVPDRFARDDEPPALMDERHTWNYKPRLWPYGYAKYLAELEVQRAVAAGLDVVIVNPSVVVGAGDVNRVSGEVIIQAARGRLLASTMGGMNVVHIEDVVQGHLAALERGRTGERYLLGGENMCLADYLNLVADVLGVRKPRMVVPAGLARRLARPLSTLLGLLALPVRADLLRFAGYYFYYDTSKARRELGLEEPQPVELAVAEAAIWYRGLGIL